MSKLSIRGVSKVFAGGTTAVDNVSLTVTEGEFFAIAARVPASAEKGVPPPIALPRIVRSGR